MKILHITTHLGGGVGDTILGYLSISEHENVVVALGWTFDYRKEEIKVPYYDEMANKHDEILKMIPDFDIVLIHWWNHPLIYDFLVRNKLPPCRLIIWSHNSGLYPPNVYTKKLIDYPDILVFTSPLSYGLENIIKSKTKKYNIWSTCGVDEYLMVEKEPHDGFIVGYVGTIDYAKMHPDFLEFCDEIDIENIKFIVVGHSDLIKESVTDKFILPGFVSRLKEWYSLFDVFGYPLNPKHYGTCDLVLQIAMACGVVPVVLNNPMELTIVTHMKNGIVVKNKKEYIEAIKMLHNDKKLRQRLSNLARKTAEERFSLEKLNCEWNKVFNDTIKYPKTIKKWQTKKKSMTPRDVFLESLGEYGKCFLNDDIEEIKKLGKEEMWKSKTKGTVHNYCQYFDDEQLKRWSELMK